MSKENKLNDNVIKTNQIKESKESKKFINIKLNELIDAQREIFDNNSIKIFFLAEAFTIRNLKKEFHNKGSMTEEQFDNIIATYLDSTVGEFLKPMLDELYSEFANEDIKKLNGEKD